MATDDPSHWGGNWSFAEGINCGYPVPKDLFWIGGVGDQDVFGYLMSSGFSPIPPYWQA